MKPIKRQDLISEQVSDELVLLDPIDLKVHHLNASAAAIFELCDGAHTVEDLAQPLLDTLASNDARQYVQATLELLAEAQLLEPESVSPTVGRRTFLKSLSGLVALPVVASVLIPTPSQASTCVPQSQCGDGGIKPTTSDPCQQPSYTNNGEPCCEGNNCNWIVDWTDGIGSKVEWRPACCLPFAPYVGDCPTPFQKDMGEWVPRIPLGTCCSCFT